MTGSLFDGEDVLQEALLKAHDASRGSDEIKNPEGWLFRIAHHAALDFLRRRARDPVKVVDDELLARIGPMSEDADSRWVVRAGLRQFLALTPSQRGAVILVDVLEHSIAEVAAITGCTLAATKSSLLRGRRRLRAAIDTPEPRRPDQISDADDARLLDYAELFNSRRFDAMRDLLVEQVRVEVVGAATLEGKAAAAVRYFGNYADRTVRAQPARIDGRAALLLQEDGREAYVVLVEFDANGIVAVRDFRHVGYELPVGSVEPFRASGGVADSAPLDGG